MVVGPGCRDGDRHGSFAAQRARGSRCRTRPRERGGVGGDRPARGRAGVRDVERQGRRGARCGPGLVRRRAAVVRHLHRGDDRGRCPRWGRGALGELRLPPGPVPRGVHRHPSGHVDRELVARPAAPGRPRRRHLRVRPQPRRRGGGGRSRMRRGRRGAGLARARRRTEPSRRLRRVLGRAGARASLSRRAGGHRVHDGGPHRRHGARARRHRAGSDRDRWWGAVVPARADRRRRARASRAPRARRRRRGHRRRDLRRRGRGSSFGLGCRGRGDVRNRRARTARGARRRLPALRPWHRGIRSRVADLSDWMVTARA